MNLKEISCPTPGGKAYESKEGLAIIVSKDKTPKWGELLHVSVSRTDRYPSWGEILDVKLHFFGDRVDAMMIMPKRTDYVNIHENCFHIWKTPEECGLI